MGRQDKDEEGYRIKVARGESEAPGRPRWTHQGFGPAVSIPKFFEVAPLIAGDRDACRQSTAEKCVPAKRSAGQWALRSGPELRPATPDPQF